MEINSWTLQDLKFPLGFRLYAAIYMENYLREDIPNTYYGRQICLGYHLESKHNTTCGVRHSHRQLLQSKLSCLSTWATS